MFIAILLPFLEAFLPILPIILFAVVNVNAYGLLVGFILTWMGSVLGSICVFLIFRTYGQARFLQRLRNHPHVLKFMVRVDRGGIVPIFVLLCFPFTPSSIINIVCALGRIETRAFIGTVMLSKAIMLFLLSFIGADIYSFIRQPLKSVIVILLFIFLWWLGKRFEEHYHNRSMKR